jgi:hypothetical protein
MVGALTLAQIFKDQPMGLISFLTSLRTTNRIEELSRRVSQKCRDSVRERLAASTAQMSFAETVGYVRARATQVVHQQVAFALASEPGLPVRAHRELLLLTTSQVVEHVVHDLYQQRRGQTARKAA